jgi:superfamily II DNA or RNA helicase
MKHTPDVDRVLKNIGAVVDSAILRDTRWHWPGLHKPWEHQRTTASFMTMYNRAFILNDPGTGKSAAAIWACEYLQMQQGGATLIIAPLTTVRSVWVQELFNVAPGARVVVLTGDSKTREAKCLQPADYYIINHDGVKSTFAHLDKMTNIKRIIVDEATAFKNVSSDRWKCLHKLIKQCSVWLMTGTPMAQSPLDAYALCKLVSPHRVPATMGGWKMQVMFPVSKFVYVPRKDATATVYDAMQPAIRFRKEDCVDLPEVTYVDYNVDLSAPQAQMLHQLKLESVADTTAGTVIAVNAAVVLGKMLQVLQGAVKRDENTVLHVDCTSRLEAVTHLCRQSEGKTITFVSYTAPINLVAARLRKEFGTDAVAVIDGNVTGTARDAIIKAFQVPGSVLRHLVAHPKTAAHGLTLTEANTTIWYGPTTSNEQYIQGNARTDRAGQKRKGTVYHIMGYALERELFARLKARNLNQQSLLDLYTNEMKEITHVASIGSTRSQESPASRAYANSNRQPRIARRAGALPFFGTARRPTN